MPRKASISFVASAVTDLQAIRTYYAEQAVPGVGDRLMPEIVLHIEGLADQPDIGRIVPEFGMDYLRELIHPPFRIVYRRDRNKVRIVRVWRSERLLKLPDSAMRKL